MAGLYVEGAGSFEEVKTEIQKNLKEIGADPWCGICKSKNLRFEDAATKFDSMEEAKPFMVQNQIEQLLTKMHFDQQGAN